MKARIQRMRQLIISGLLFSTLALASPAYGTTYYVDGTGGNDSNSCTQAQTHITAKATVQAGIGCLSGGDTLSIKPGTYTMTEAAGNSCATEIPSGTSWTNATTMTAFDPTNDPTIKVDAINDNFVFNFFSGNCTQDDYIILDNLIIDGGNVFDQVTRANDGVAYQNIKTDGTSGHIRLSNSLCKNAWSHCWLIAGAGGNEVLDNEVTGNGASGRLGSHQLYISSPDNLLDGNHIHDGGNRGIQMASGYHPRNVIRNNLIHGQGTGIQVYGSDGNLVHHNIIYDIGGTDKGPYSLEFGGPLTAQPGGWGILLNYFQGTNNQVYNNTIYDFQVSVASGGIQIQGGLCEDLSVRDNIVQSGRQNGASVFGIRAIPNCGLSGNVTVENNFVFDVTGGAFSNSSSATFQNNSSVDPEMVDPANQNFCLKATSPAIGAGAADCQTGVPSSPSSLVVAPQ